MPARRRLLGGAALAALAASARAQEVLQPRAAVTDPLEVPEWMRVSGGPVLMNPYGRPSSFEAGVIRRAARQAPVPGAASSLTPLADLNGSLTPNGLVYERHHAGVPQIDPAQHRLAIHGLVRTPKLLTMDDVLRLPSESRIHFMECSGNTASEWNGPSGLPVQMTHGLLSCCEWTGVRLSTLLEAVGGVVADAASGATPRWVLAEGADGAAMTRSLPLDRVLDLALVVYAQNGERLRPENGYPLRLIVPGFEGNTHVKWLRRLKIVAAPLQTREETSRYTSLMPDGRARQFVFEMDAKSVITRPSPGQRLAGPGDYPITGLAWSGRGAIRQVEVSTDGGANWRPARLDAVRDRALTHFHADWQWRGEPTVILSRATDSTGYLQPTREALVAARGVNSLYHYNGIQPWRIGADGSVRNA